MKKLMLIAVVLLTCACNKDETPTLLPEKEPAPKEYRIAVVLPTDGATGNYWKKSIDWSLENLNKALIAQRDIRVTAEWHNEEQPEEALKALFNKLAAREDVCAIIGPLYSANAKIAAGECYKTKKMLIPATVSSESLMRQYAGKGFLWCLAENDISQCEVLLARAKQKGAKKVSLLTSDDAYGQTFIDWFAFQATELQLKVNSVEVYAANNVTEKMEAILQNYPGREDCLICVPNTQEIAATMNTCRRNRTEGDSFLLFSDVAYIVPKDATFEGMEGITQSHDPESGFAVAYEVKYGDAPGYGSAHYYDAVTLAGLAILHADLTGETDLNASLALIIDGEDDEINTCSEAGVEQAATRLIAGQYPHCSGASGTLRFDKSVHTNVLHSVYCHWQVYGGKHLVLEYNTSDSSRRTDASMANWNWKITRQPDLTLGPPVWYPDKNKLYAMIVATSSGWENYRHQANAYAVYQLLKRNGVDDDHILLISEDDIAHHPKNPRPGFIQSSLSDENLYDGVKVDYRLSEVKFKDLPSLFRASATFHPGGTDNLFIYWAGHGEPEGPRWLNDVIPSRQVVEDFLQQLKRKSCYRKLLVVMETCYAGQVGLELQYRVPHMLCMTAANDKETSKASITDASGQVWISNSFTDNLLQQLILDGDKLTIYDLYNRLFHKTIGSHVSLYGREFGGLRKSSTMEFIYP